MITCDTNILLHAFNKSSQFHDSAWAFISKHSSDPDFAMCELVLIELYVLLRNPAVLKTPLSAEKAAAICRQYRQNKLWRIIDYPGQLMNKVWKIAAQTDFPRRSIFDARLALTLRYHGVTEFATGNIGHFKSFGFTKLWNPLL